MTTATATRRPAGSAYVIDVALSDGTFRTLGGARAARATAVTVIRYGNSPYRLSVRSSAAAAAAEVARAATAHTMRHAGHLFDIPAADIAVAVAVAEAAR